MTMSIPIPDLLTQARDAAVPFVCEPIAIDAARILRLHGYAQQATRGKARRTRGRNKVYQIAEQMAASVVQLAVPKVVIRCLSMRLVRGGTVEFEDASILQCAAFDHYLYACDEVLVFVLSAGSELDSEIARHMSASRAVEALFLDSAGWLYVEAMTRQLVMALKATMQDSSHLRLGRRLGPGYRYRVQGHDCEWPLEQQHSLFALLGADALPVQLLDSGGMQPQMSRSGMFGLQSISCSVQ